MTDTRSREVQYAEDSYESLRSINHILINRKATPAPLVYDMLGELGSLGGGLDQVLRHLSRGLAASLTEYDVYDENRDPAESVQLARKALDDAASLASQIGDLLEQAQGAINLQGYKTGDHVVR